MVKSLNNKKSVNRRSKRNNNDSVISLNTYRSNQNRSSQTYPQKSSNKTNNSPSNSSVNPKKTSGLNTFFLYLLRFIIAGVGLGVIAGTALHYVTQKQVLATANIQKTPEETKENPLKNEFKNPLVLREENINLKTQVQELIAKNPQLKPQLFFADLDTGSYLDINGNLPIPAASTIKIPLLVAFFQDVDAGKIQLDEKLTMTEKVKVGEAGNMQYQPVGTQFTALETVTNMIVVSDNTATNMILERLGGKDVVNQRFKEWGLKNTVINNILPDLEGTNMTSPKDLALVLALVNNAELVSLKNRDRILGIMQKTKTRTLLPQGLEPNAIISHKTGTLATILGDAGIIDTTNGKRYIGVALVQRPKDDPAARTLIQEISRTVYNNFKQNSVTNSSPTNTNSTIENTPASPTPNSEFITPNNKPNSNSNPEEDVTSMGG
jgi:beta-lactamase class A